MLSQKQIVLRSSRKYTTGVISQTFTLGEMYKVGNGKYYKKYKFIKVTPKGYNFLDPETNKCIFYPHLYRKSGTIMTNTEETVTVGVGFLHKNIMIN